MKPIEFWAVVNKVQTLADGGIRVALDLPEQFVVQMAELAACKIHGQVLDVSLTEHGQRTKLSGDVIGAELSDFHEG